MRTIQYTQYYANATKYCSVKSIGLIETLETPSSAPSFALTVESGGVCNRVGGRIAFLSSPSTLTDEAIQPSLATLHVETDLKN